MHPTTSPVGVVLDIATTRGPDLFDGTPDAWRLFAAATAALIVGVLALAIAALSLPGDLDDPTSLYFATGTTLIVAVLAVIIAIDHQPTGDTIYNPPTPTQAQAALHTAYGVTIPEPYLERIINDHTHGRDNQGTPTTVPATHGTTPTECNLWTTNNTPYTVTLICKDTTH